MTWARSALAVLVFALAGCPPRTDPGYETPPADGIEVRDPVTGDRCLKTPLSEAAVANDRTYYFCCPDCRARFAADPDRYLAR